MENDANHDGEVRVEMTITEQVGGGFSAQSHIWQGDARLGFVGTSGSDMDDARANALEAVRNFLKARAFASHAQTVQETFWIPSDGKD